MYLTFENDYSTINYQRQLFETMSSGSTSALRIANRESVLRCIARGGSTRIKLAEETGLTTAAISRITRQLIDAEIVEEAAEPAHMGGRGRRTRSLQLSPTGAYLVVMVITANRRSIAIANCRGELCASRQLEGIAMTPATDALRAFSDTANLLIQQHNIDRSRILGVSVIVAVNVNPAIHNKLSSAVLGWKNVDVKRFVEEHTGLTVHLEARAAALLQSELFYKPAVEDRSVVLINNGWRIGSCVSLDGKLLETSAGRIGQVAHVTASDSDTRCYCGKLGCMDAVASGAAIVNTLENSRLLNCSLDTPLNRKLTLALENAKPDTAIARVFRTAGEYLGDALNNISSLYSPERILLAGTVCRQSDYIAGVQSRFTANGISDPATCLSISEVGSLDAAVRSGLNAFLFSRSLDINQLRTTSLSA